MVKKTVFVSLANLRAFGVRVKITGGNRALVMRSLMKVGTSTNDEDQKHVDISSYDG